jgi:5-methylcytosine-specific restriction endonuclease McrA
MAIEWWEQFNKETECKHTSTRPTRVVKSNGVACVYLQCQKCGEKVKEVSKRDYDVDRLPAFDEDLRDRVRARNSERRQELSQQARDAESISWRAQYEAYLKSSHWQVLRRKVIQRDHFECQNCFTRVTDTTAHVHHMSYDGLNRTGHSFAFECVTLCRKCHEDFHPHMKEQQRRQDVAHLMGVEW